MSLMTFSCPQNMQSLASPPLHVLGWWHSSSGGFQDSNSWKETVVWEELDEMLTSIRQPQPQPCYSSIPFSWPKLRTDPLWNITVIYENAQLWELASLTPLFWVICASVKVWLYDGWGFMVWRKVEYDLSFDVEGVGLRSITQLRAA